jgi:hypothetical protein
MTPTEYRQMLTDALDKPGDDQTMVLTLVNAKGTGLGARGERLNETVRGFTKPDVRRMIRHVDKLQAQADAADAIPAPVVSISGDRISVGCKPCGLSVDASNTDFGRALVAAWPGIHAKDCKPARRSNP